MGLKITWLDKINVDYAFHYQIFLNFVTLLQISSILGLSLSLRMIEDVLMLHDICQFSAHHGNIPSPPW